MIHKIDWLSFTYWINGQPGEFRKDLLRAALLRYKPSWVQLDTDTSKPAPARKGFVFGICNENHTTNLWINQQGLILVEVTGQGCTDLEQRGLLMDVVTQYADRMTRIDLASDILCDTNPRDFVQQRGETKITAVGDFVSSTGHTCYVGSRKSDRKAKVYRYYAPHPRAAFLRIEYTYSGHQAKFAAKHLLQHGLESTIFASAARYQWQHPVWQPEQPSAAELKAWRPERGEAKTVTWLRTQVLAAIQKLDKAGVMSVQEYCDFLLASVPA